ncbi:MAG: serine O-acetyltransferase [Gaiellaceae bacterium]
MLRKMRHDIRAVKERDPAARNWLEIVLCYPGLWAVWWHRVAHVLWHWRLRLVARWISQLARALTGIEIHPAATIGPGLFIDHGMGVVIGETAELGAEVTLYQGVTLGGTSLEKGKRHPTLGDGVVVGAGAKVLGAITVGEYSRIGANAVVVKPVPSGAVVVGVPGEIVTAKETRPARTMPNLEHGQLPDVLGDAVADLVARVDELERRVEGGAHHELAFAPSDGVWCESEDPSI